MNWISGCSFLRSCSGFSCGDISPLRDVFTVQRPVGVATMTAGEPKPLYQVGKLEENNREVTVIHSREAGTQIIQHQDSLTDYCSIVSKSSMEPSDLDSLSTTDCTLSNSGSCVLQNAEPEESGGDQDQQLSNNTDPGSAETRKSSTSQLLQAFTLLPVKGTLWIPRYGRNV